MTMTVTTEKGKVELEIPLYSTHSQREEIIREAGIKSWENYQIGGLTITLDQHKEWLLAEKLVRE